MDEVLFPASCDHCGVRVTGGRWSGDAGGAAVAEGRNGGLPLCERCLGDVRRAAALPACDACGSLLGQEGAGCQRCGGKGYPHVAAVWRWGPYEGPLRTLLLKAKFRHGWGVLRPLGRELAGAVDNAAFDLVVPVPMTRWRAFVRGYNVAELLGREVTAARGVPWSRALARRRAGVRQSSLHSHAARQRNVADAFRVARPADVSGRHVLLVDDILTSGATVTACARLLREAGAKRVAAAVVAVADPRSAPLDPDGP